MDEIISLRGVPEDPPPPYGSVFFRNNDVEEGPGRVAGATITCRVCQNSINILGKMDQCVVKCPRCLEATPIQNAPAGKKYVRCPCRCLLVCKVSALRIACPRPKCRRVIDLSVHCHSPIRTNMYRVVCSYCNGLFEFNVNYNSLAKCPHCQKISSVGPEYTRSRAMKILKYGVAPLFVFVVLFLTTISSAGSHRWLFVLYAIFFGINLAIWYRFFYYLKMKVSKIDGPVPVSA